MPLQVTNYVAASENGSILTSSVGSVYVQLGSTSTSTVLKRVIISNDTGTDLEIKRNTGVTDQYGSTVGFPVFNRSYYSFEAVSKLEQLSVRRIDQSNTQVLVKFTWEA